MSTSESTAGRKYTLKQDRVDLRDFCFKSVDFEKLEHLPSKIDLRSLCSPIADQGSLGSCTANAIATGLREYLLIKNKLPLVRLSRLFLYYQERLLEGTVTQDSGAMISDGMKVLQKIGVCPEADMPYFINRFTLPPTQHQMMDAAQFKIINYYRIPSLIMMKAALAEGNPVVIGMKVFTSFETEAVARTGIATNPKRGDQLLGGHAVCAVGYDDTMKVGRTKGFAIVRNSWGEGWGDKGYFYLPYSFFAKNVMDMWTGM